MDKRAELRSPLHQLFIDFKKIFASVNLTAAVLFPGQSALDLNKEVSGLKANAKRLSLAHHRTILVCINLHNNVSVKKPGCVASTNSGISLPFDALTTLNSPSLF